MKNKSMLILSSLISLALLVLAAYALPSSLTVSAPTSITVDDFFSIRATYTSNGSLVCGASCSITGGWIGSGNMYESGCEYFYDTTAPTPASSYSFTVTCNRTNYDIASSNFGIIVEKKSSTLTTYANPNNPSIGSTVEMSVYYSTSSGSCSSAVTSNAGFSQTISLSYCSSCGYYRGYVTLPNIYSQFTATTTCSSDKYRTAIATTAFTNRKESSEIYANLPFTVYYGDEINVRVSYTHLGSPISGSCTAALKRGNVKLEEKAMAYLSGEYSAKVKIPLEAGPYSLESVCTSGRYETATTTDFIYPNNRQTDMSIISPTASTTYPTEPVIFTVSYRDRLAGRFVDNAICNVISGKTSYQLKAVGSSYATTIQNLYPDNYTFVVECSKSFHEKRTSTFSLNVQPLPIIIMFTNIKPEYKVGEDIVLMARVSDRFGTKASPDCNATVDVYDPLFDKVRDTRRLDVTKDEDVYEMNIPNSNETAVFHITVTCGGTIYETTSIKVELKAELLAKERKEVLTIALGTSTAILLAMLFLIRKRLKL